MVELLLVDDHPIWRDALKLVLVRGGYEVAHQAKSLAEARAVLNNHAGFDLVISDLQLPDGTGEELLAEVKPVVIVSADERPSTVRRCMRAGAVGYIPKSAPPADVLAVLEDALSGKVRISASLAVALVNYEIDNPEVILTPREWDVLTMLRDGSTSTRQIAKALFITERTVKAHMASIFEKSEVTNRAGILVEDSKGRYSKA